MLVVEDAEEMRYVYGRLFEPVGLQVDFAKDGDEAMEKVDSRTYGVIVLDLMLSRVSGLSVLKHLQIAHPQWTPRVLLVTSMGWGDLQKRVPAPFLERVFIKPVDHDQLVTCVRGMAIEFCD